MLWATKCAIVSGGRSQNYTMPKVRDILVHVSVELAQRRRICHRKRSEHSISGGELCLVIQDPTDGSSRNYCRACAHEILISAQARLAQLRGELQLAAEPAHERRN